MDGRTQRCCGQHPITLMKVRALRCTQPVSAPFELDAHHAAYELDREEIRSNRRIDASIRSQITPHDALQTTAEHRLRSQHLANFAHQKIKRPLITLLS